MWFFLLLFGFVLFFQGMRAFNLLWLHWEEPASVEQIFESGEKDGLLLKAGTPEELSRDSQPGPASWRSSSVF